MKHWSHRKLVWWGFVKTKLSQEEVLIPIKRQPYNMYNMEPPQPGLDTGPRYMNPLQWRQPLTNPLIMYTFNAISILCTPHTILSVLQAFHVDRSAMGAFASKMVGMCYDTENLLVMILSGRSSRIMYNYLWMIKSCKSKYDLGIRELA